MWFNAIIREKSYQYLLFLFMLQVAFMDKRNKLELHGCRQFVP